jgi:hypothetical protein
MGGFGSSRWTMSVARPTTEGLLRLDVRQLARQGALQIGTSSLVTWPSGASITVHSVAQDVVVIRYMVSDPHAGAVIVREYIRLSTTPGTFGGERVWLLCPGCASRRAILYAYGGRLRCTVCHRLAYASTRQR